MLNTLLKLEIFLVFDNPSNPLVYNQKVKIWGLAGWVGAWLVIQGLVGSRVAKP